MEKIRRATDLVLCIFPFEPAIYAKQGVAAAYVGHPLAGAIPLEVPRAASRAALGLGADDVVVAVLPGSRRAEIQYIAPRLLAAAETMHRQRPGLRFVLPVVPGLRHMLEPMRRHHAPSARDRAARRPVPRRAGGGDVVLVASGTATLETALFKRPMVVVYAMHALSWQMSKRMNYQPWVALPNILLRDFAVPGAAAGRRNPREHRPRRARLARRSRQRARRWSGASRALHAELRCDTARLATDAIEEVLAR